MSPASSEVPAMSCGHDTPSAHASTRPTLAGSTPTLKLTPWVSCTRSSASARPPRVSTISSTW
eukprot:scaffold46777_cov60-Phaeocystis_antarctica.AAC.1